MPSSAYLAQSIITLHCFSLFVAVVILALSIRDCGILSLCLNPFFALLTIGYHVGILLLAYRKPEDAPPPPVGYTIAAYLLSAAWLGSYIAMSIVLWSRETDIPLFGIDILIPQTMRTTQKIQMMLDPLEFVIIGNLAIKDTILRRQERRWSKSKAEDIEWDIEGSHEEVPTTYSEPTETAES